MPASAPTHSLKKVSLRAFPRGQRFALRCQERMALPPVAQLLTSCCGD